MSRWHIVPLSEVPHCQPQLVEWLWRAFGDEKSGGFFTSVIESSMQGADFPQTFVALDGERPMGTVGVWRCDLISRQDLFPWLAALYVDESARGSGLSAALQAYAEGWCRARGFADLYLYALCADYYERFGWRYIGDALDYPDVVVRLYHKALG
ncbi:GNAT family N-acetyltransferase [Erwinia sp. PK3-005]